ncbi:hypothetical protein CP556_21775 [Natrinema sp. CBA1119]|nr:PQQ-binding-like beta-propeller repeat protein [Natrinema sp. CBA1119]PGF14339.1 hypothetical protein CP556_21775 [Natrinema sp. CBA1119]
MDGISESSTQARKQRQPCFRGVRIGLFIGLLTIVLLGTAAAGAAVPATNATAIDTQIVDDPAAWPNTGYDERNSRVSDGTPPAEAPDRAWSFDLVENDTERLTDPIIVEDTVLFGTEWSSSDTEHGSLTAVNLTTGDQRWSFGVNTEQKFTYDIATDGETVIIGENDALYGVDLKTGTREWQKDHSRFTGYGITSHEGVVYTRLGDRGSVHALDPTNGTSHWNTPLPNIDEQTGETNAPAVGNGSVYVAGSCSVSDSERKFLCITALDRDTGNVKWQTVSDSVESTGSISDPVLADGTLYVRLEKDYLRESPQLVAFNISTRSVTDSRSVESGAPIAVTEETIFTTDSNGIVAIDRETTATRWTNEGTTSVVVGEQVLTVDGTQLRALSSSSGDEQWSTSVSTSNIDALSAGMAASNGTIVVLGEISVTSIVALRSHSQGQQLHLRKSWSSPRIHKSEHRPASTQVGSLGRTTGGTSTKMERPTLVVPLSIISSTRLVGST